MNINAQSALVIAAALLALLAWLARYEITPAGGGESAFGGAYRLDRWTGEVVYLRRWEATEVEIAPPNESSPP